MRTRTAGHHMGADRSVPAQYVLAQSLPDVRARSLAVACVLLHAAYVTCVLITLTA